MMKLRLTPLERSIRDLALKEIRASDSLHAEYLKWQRVEDRECWMGLALLGVLFIILVAFPAVAIFLRWEESAWERFLAGGPPIEAVLAAQAIFLTGLAIGDGAESPFNKNAFSVYCAFPFTDRDFHRLVVRRELLCALIMTMIASPVYLYIAVHGASALGWLGFGLAVMAQLVVFLAIAYWGRSRTERKNSSGRRMFLGGFLFECALFVPWVPKVPRAIYSTLFLLPGGWVNGVFWHGVLNANLWGWLYLLPIGWAAIYVVLSLRKPFVIREFQFQANQLSVVELEDGRKLTQWRMRRRTNATEASASRDNGLPETAVSPRSVAETFRRQVDWQCKGWVDSFVADGLTRRERAIQLFWRESDVSYTRSFYILLIGVILGFGIAYWMPPEVSLKAFSVTCFGAICVGSVSGFGRNTQYGANLLPMDLWEPLQTSLNVYLRLAPLWLAPTVAIAILIGLIQGRSLFESVAIGSLPFLWTLALLPSAMLFQTLMEGVYRIEGPVQAIKTIVAPGIAVAAAIFIGAASVHATEFAVGFACLVGSTVAGWLGWFYFSWAFHHLPIDVGPPQTAPR